MKEREAEAAWRASHRSDRAGATDVPTSAPVEPRHLIEDRASVIAARVDHAFVVPGTGVFISGWLVDPHDRITLLRARAGDAIAELAVGDLVRSPRDDIAGRYRAWPDAARTPLGLAGLVRLEGVPDRVIARTLSLELDDASGRRWRLLPRPVVEAAADPLTTIRDILSLLGPRTAEDLDRHLGPAVSALWVPREHRWRVAEVGRQPAAPRVSIVVPVHDRVDLIEYQMALFAADPDLRDAELVYVIDDPRLADDAVRTCSAIHPVFRVPCRLVLCDRIHGPSAAVNIGTQVARGETLLLLSARVMPARHGWLSDLREAYAALPRPGLLAPRLLSPDGTLRHDGTWFVQEPGLPGIWRRDHPGEGLLPGEAGPRVPRQVPAVLKDCLMVAGDLYREVGGLDEGYIGGFSDPDLCFRARQLGHESHVAAWVGLFHVGPRSERLHGDGRWLRSLELHDAWRLSRRWAHVLGETQGATTRA